MRGVGLSGRRTGITRKDKGGNMAYITILVSKKRPHGAETEGEPPQAGTWGTIFKANGGFGYFYHGIDSEGSRFETEDVGFDYESLEDAVASMRRNYSASR